MRRRLPLAIGLALAGLVGLYAFLPSLIQRYVNRVLDRNAVYEGEVGDVDLALWRGAYVIDDIEIRKRGGKVPVPFFLSERVDLSIEWRALWHGAVVGELVFERPKLNFVAARAAAQRQGGVGADWREMVEQLFPVSFNRVEVRDGSIHYRDFDARPPVDVYLQHVDLVAHDLANRRTEGRVARATARAVPMNAGKLEASATFDPFADRPSFDFDGAVTGADLTQWNGFLRAYLHADVEAGHFAIYSELQAESGRFEGYLKPFFRDVDVLQFKQERKEQGLLASLWEAVVGATVEVFEDRSEDQVAMRIPISGTVAEPRAGFWTALGTALRNAFLDSLLPQLEGSVGDR